MSPSSRQRPRPKGRSTSTSSRRSLYVIAGVVAVVLLALGVALVAGSGGDDDTATDTTSDATGSGGGDAAAVSDDTPATVDGTPLPPLPSGGSDPATGTAMPTLSGTTLDGEAITIPEPGRPTMILFLAHWCPHCQAELPNLVTMAEQGQLDDVRPVIVATGTDEAAPNYPPGPWIEDEGWDGNVILDDEQYSAGDAYGLTGYPYLVLVDTDGNVIARASGELGLEGLLTFVEQAS